MCPCPEFEYKDHPRKREVLSRQHRALLFCLWNGTIDALVHAIDTRRVHRDIFLELTPPGYEYYAGHYRGEDFPCLKEYRVCIPGDPTVGCPPATVIGYIRELGQLITAGIIALDRTKEIPDGQLPKEQKVLFAVAFVCRVFDVFLRIHPYANGNGHVGRFIVWAVLVRMGYWPTRFSIDPRPTDFDTQLLRLYRSGQPQHLEKYILDHLSAN